MNEPTNILETIADSVSDGILLIDRDYKITFANAAIHRVFGTDNCVKGLTCHYLFHRLSSPCNNNYEFKRCPYNEVVSTREKVSVTYPFILKSGIKRIFNVTASPVMDKTDNAVLHVVKVLKDITDKRQTENMLKAAEVKYQNLADNALIGVYRTNIKGIILYANRALAEMLEYKSPAEMMKGNSLQRYKNPSDREVLLNKLREKGSVNNYKVELLTKKGRNKHLLLSASLDGDIISGMIMDASDRR